MQIWPDWKSVGRVFRLLLAIIGIFLALVAAHMVITRLCMINASITYGQ